MYVSSAVTYTREHLNYDTQGALTMVSDPTQGVSRAIFTFAIEFVGLALTADRDNKDL